MTDAAEIRRKFHQVDAWIFDLDNTLYLRTFSLEQIDSRIKGYVSKLLNISTEEAFRLQKDYYKRYGTSMRGLMIEHGMSPDDFLAYVHDIDHSPLQANPELCAAIAALPPPQVRLHLGHPLACRGGDAAPRNREPFRRRLRHCRRRLLPKPHRPTYEKFLADHGSIRPVPPCSRISRAISRRRNALGMKTVLVVPERTREVFREAWEFEGRDDDHVDFVTDDLTAFLVMLRL